MRVIRIVEFKVRRLGGITKILSIPNADRCIRKCTFSHAPIYTSISSLESRTLTTCTNI